MKNSTLVMVCSLAGVCAGSAHAQLYSLTTYKVFPTTSGESASLKVKAVIGLLASEIEARDPYFGSNIGILLGAWGENFNPLPDPTWY